MELVDIKKVLFLMLIIAVSLTVSAKGKWNIGLGSTHGFNNSDLYIWEYKVEKTMSHGIYIKLGYELNLFPHFNLAITPGFQQHYDEVGINNINVETYSYHFDIPIDIYYYFLKKWSAHAGVSLQNYREIDEFALERSYNARLNLNLGISYHFSGHWAIELGYSRIISDQRHSFLIRNYPNHINLGVRYRFNFKKHEHEN